MNPISGPDSVDRPSRLHPRTAPAVQPLPGLPPVKLDPTGEGWSIMLFFAFCSPARSLTLSGLMETPLVGKKLKSWGWGLEGHTKDRPWDIGIDFKWDPSGGGDIRIRRGFMSTIACSPLKITAIVPGTSCLAKAQRANRPRR